ncbi:MAG: hypothetical protein ACQESC_02730 [Nanobdellota archaeon]
MVVLDESRIRKIFETAQSIVNDSGYNKQYSDILGQLFASGLFNNTPVPLHDIDKEFTLQLNKFVREYNNSDINRIDMINSEVPISNIAYANDSLFSTYTNFSLQKGRIYESVLGSYAKDFKSQESFPYPYFQSDLPDEGLLFKLVVNDMSENKFIYVDQEKENHIVRASESLVKTFKKQFSRKYV